MPIIFTPPYQWLDNEDESIILKDSEGKEVDRTPVLSDTKDDNRCWVHKNSEWVFEVKEEFGKPTTPMPSQLLLKEGYAEARDYPNEFNPDEWIGSPLDFFALTPTPLPTLTPTLTPSPSSVYTPSPTPMPVLNFCSL